MAEVLNQQEIDNLLNNVKSGTEEKNDSFEQKEAVPFDFRLPNRISKHQLRTITNIHENFAESLSSFLVSKLQTLVSTSVASVDQLYYSEYVLSVSNPSCLFTFDIRNTDIKGILEFSPELALVLVDRLLGGSGEGKKESKIITPIEQKVLNVVVESAMVNLTKAWSVVDKLDFAVDRFEPDIDFAQITSQNESVLLISFEVMIGEESHFMNLCFATFSFDRILAKLASQKFSSIRPTDYHGSTSREVISKSLLYAEVPLKIELGKSSISVAEFMNLEVGDIINLNKKISDNCEVKMENKVIGYGRPGLVNKRKAIKIIQKLI
ncbi:MAG: flagellar motor switch protein FliM [Ignavibacteriales bacterium]|jgi:flagellar motor switch protein FliM|nr:MAG: flagellar motor switch protein FliM [Ignavibacteriales bacterium]